MFTLSAKSRSARFGLALAVAVALGLGLSSPAQAGGSSDLPQKLQAYLDTLGVSENDIQSVHVAKRINQAGRKADYFNYWLSVRGAEGSLVVQADRSANVISAFTTGDFRLREVAHHGF